MDKKLFDEVVSNLRACLLSAKGGVSFSALNSDYRKLLGESIPYQNLGYPSLEELLNDIPGLIITRKSDGWNVAAKPTEDTIHLTTMIQRQKSASTRKRPRKRGDAYRRMGRSGRSSVAYKPAQQTMHPRNQQQSTPVVKQSFKSLNITPLMSIPTPFSPPVKQPAELKISKEQISQQPKPYKTLSERLMYKATIKPPEPEVGTPSPPSAIKLVPGIQFASSSTPLRTSVKPTTTGQSPSSDNYGPCKELELLTKSMELSDPVYKIVSWLHKQQKQSFYSCQVQIGTHSYTSYPEESITPEQAKTVVASKALLELAENGCPSETMNRNLIKERVLQIMARHDSGVFQHQLPIHYKNQYKEDLPKDWEKHIEMYSEISQKRDANFTILNYVPRNEASVSDKVSASLISGIDKMQLNSNRHSVPGVIQPPDEEYWDVCITTVISTTEIWARLISDEYSVKFQNMIEDMETYYNITANTLATSNVKVGNYYAVCDEDSWQRVKCTDFKVTTGVAVVFFIDYGDETSVHYSTLYPLEQKFCIVPAQAVKLRLAEFEEFSDCDEVNTYLEELLMDQMLVAQVLSYKFVEDKVMASVILYDTKSNTDVNLNEILFSKMEHSILQPKLIRERRVSEVFVTHVMDDGTVFLNASSHSRQYLRNIMNSMVRFGLTAENIKKSRAKEVEYGKIYFVQSTEDGNWYRGIVTHVMANSKVKVFTIDVGKSITAERISHLLVLDQLSEILAKYPHQAVSVRLHGVQQSPCNQDMAARLRLLAPPNELVLAKIIRADPKSSRPSVELFKRLEPNNILISINNTLAIDLELEGSEDVSKNDVQPKQNLEKTVSRRGLTNDGENCIKYPKLLVIPNLGSYFDVHISSARSPDSFIIQPYQDQAKLEAMMLKLQEVYANYRGPYPSYDSIKTGNLYAVKHDGRFYRVCIVRVITEEMVSVYFCDFGNFFIINFDELQPLDRRFLDLPHQAMKARLTGVQPVKKNWSDEDRLRFQQLVVNRDFVSIVIDSRPDPLYADHSVLSLQLIDVSGATDIHVDKVLILEGRAIAVEQY